MSSSTACSPGRPARNVGSLADILYLVEAIRLNELAIQEIPLDHVQGAVIRANLAMALAMRCELHALRLPAAHAAGRAVGPDGYRGGSDGPAKFDPGWGIHAPAVPGVGDAALAVSVDHQDGGDPQVAGRSPAGAASAVADLV